MKAEDIKIGMEAIPENDMGSMGVIRSLPDENGEVKLVWYERTKYEDSRLFHHDDLEYPNPEKDRAIADQMQVKIDQAKDAFEQAFKALQELEAIAHTVQMGLSELKYDDLITVHELEDTLERNGWSSSSLWC
jgi:hypothetical protein